MSLLDGITVLCEGIDQGLDVRLLEIVRNALQSDVPVATRINFRPAGSKADLAPMIRAHRQSRNTRLVFAVRDRDFLPRVLVDEHRVKAFADADTLPFPLSRHCLESYLLEPAFVMAALGLADVQAQLDVLAAARHWVDVGRAVLDDAGWHVRRVRLDLAGNPTTEIEARELVRAAVQAYTTHLSDGRALTRAMTKFDDVLADFAQDALWCRVDGKELLVALEGQLRSAGKLPRGDLLEHLLRHAEKAGPPAPLMDDLRVVFARVALQVPVAH